MKALLVSLLLPVLVISAAEAQPPRTISYQGILCDSTGQPRPDATYVLTFRLYDSAGGGAHIWGEQKSLPTKQGLFSTQLGDQVPFGAAVTFERQYWLSVQVGMEAELSPRLVLAAVGNSFRAERADTASHALRAAPTALGYEAEALGERSTAMGDHTRALGYASTAMGSQTEAAGDRSTAMGYFTTASGLYATAMGSYATASSAGSVAMGNYTTASGGSAAAIGYHTAASGLTSAAIGNFVTASGDFSTAMGSYVSTNTRNGSFIIGDNSSSSLIAANTDDNQFMAVFAGGYRVWSNRNGTQGVYMNGGTSGWTNISDRNLKENFRPIDGEGLLAKIRMLPITEWNYRGADPSIRYVGPVAQDFHEAFHLGGADSLGINSICMDGVSMAAVQALEKRTAELREKAAELEVVKAELADVKARLRRLEAALTMQRDVTREITAVTAEAAERR